MFAPLAEVVATLTDYHAQIGAPVRTAEVKSLRTDHECFELALEDTCCAPEASSSRRLDGAVLVVGSGRSGCEIAHELVEAGRTVHAWVADAVAAHLETARAV